MVRARFGDRVTSLVCTRRTLELRFPFPPAAVTELFATCYGPTVATLRATDPDGASRLRDELTQLFQRAQPRHRRHDDGGGRVSRRPGTRRLTATTRRARATTRTHSARGEHMSQRSDALADRLEQGARALAALRAASPTRSGRPGSQGRPQDRRRGPSRRHHVPAGDPAGADAGRRRAGHGRDLGRRQRDECRARQGVRRRHERGGAGSAPAQQRGGRGRHPGAERRGSSIGRRRCRSTPMPRSRASSCWRITRSATATTTSPRIRGGGEAPARRAA